MARTITEITAQIDAAIAWETTLAALNSPSATAIWRLMRYVCAAAIWTLEVFYDAFRIEVTTLIAQQKPHTLRWYRSKALDYQHGSTLIAGSDLYDNTGLTEAQISALKIVRYSAATEGTDGKVVIKVAKDVAGSITPLSVAELAGVTAYFSQIKDAGVLIQTRSAQADRLKVAVDVYYDSTMLDSNGGRLDGSGSTPVQDAASAYLKTLAFDGEFVKAYFVDALQRVEGVVVPEIRLCQARRNDDPTFAAVDVFYQTFSGFLKFDQPTDLTLNFIAA